MPIDSHDQEIDMTTLITPDLSSLEYLTAAYCRNVRSASSYRQANRITDAMVADQCARDCLMRIAAHLPDARIQSLSDEASQAGDEAMVGLCAAAMGGDEKARLQCAQAIADAAAHPATETKHSVTPGWYVLQDSNGKDPCLVKVYVPRSHETLADQSLHVGFGVWDGGAFVPLSDIKDDSIFISVRIINARSGKDYSDAFER